MATYYIDSVNGNDGNTGLLTTQRLKTISRFGTLIGTSPGAIGIVYPGYYAPMGTIAGAGGVGNPIIIKCQGPRPTASNLTNPAVNAIISGADNGTPVATAGFLGNTITWTNTGTNNVYSAPCTWIPRRCSYNNSVANGPFDLYPYSSLAELNALRISSAAVQPGVYPAGYSSGTHANGTTYPTYIPGPHGGFFANGTTLYVRLDPSYTTNVNPGAVSGSTPINRMMIGAAGSFGVGLSTTGNITWDGFVFEGHGTGITVKGSNTKIRNCFFRQNVTDIDVTAQGSYIGEFNDHGAYPTFQDYVVAFTDYLASPSSYQDPKKMTVPWSNYGVGWGRKLVNYLNGTNVVTNYEEAFYRNLGSNCILRNNYFHDGLDAISSWATSNSVNLLCDSNFIVRMIDNALETEEQAAGLKFTNNEMKDVFECISIQPITPPPFPSAITIAHNTYYDTPGNLQLWKNIYLAGGLGRAFFKWMIVGSLTFPSPAVVPTHIDITGGLIFHNNTVYKLWGEMFHWNMPFNGSVSCPFGPIAFFNNFICDQYTLQANDRETVVTPNAIDWSGITFQNNVVCAPNPKACGPGVLIAGKNGLVLTNLADAQFTDPTSTFNFVPMASSILANRGLLTYTNAAVPPAVSVNSTVGCFDVGATRPPVATTYGVQTGTP